MSLSRGVKRALFGGVLLAGLTITGCSTPTADTVNAQWTLIDSALVTPASTRLELGVMRIACSSGNTGEVTGTQVDYSATTISIGIVVEPLEEKPQSCQSNETVPFTLELEEPVGQRSLIDASCAREDQPADDSQGCAQNGLRWQP
ncbi:hypothetical protein [Arthrobacter sp. NIO-1057]|uniref:hypothetical protein n=1 Tax=Arthrobacter sp. NIO-1057 TaxID=993071 RepID=UPI000817AFB9|nr:hypothetical protein [Arthrobacter sp. NIO-1057]SCB80717.1 hypothetical protein GA0061084_0348 [Arthrobacter sp. NIO-1057]